MDMPQQGSITIVKDAIPDGPQIFEFIGDLGAFDLVDGGPGSKSLAFPSLTPGVYDITEVVPPGWSLTSILRIDPDGGTTVNVGTATATIDLDDAEVVTCTFVDEREEPVPTAPIPTLSQWMLLLLATLLAAAALLALGRPVMP